MIIYKCPKCGYELVIGIEISMGPPPKHKCPKCNMLMKKMKEGEGEEPSKLEVGKDYKTRGGWKARIIWKVAQRVEFYAIHKPETDQETGPIHHKGDGKAVCILAVGEPPSYGQHPADIIEEWSK